MKGHVGRFAPFISACLPRHQSDIINATMEALDALKERVRRPQRAQNILKFTPLSPDVQRYLSHVYRVLALCLLICAAGVLLSSVGPWTTAVGTIGTLVATPWLLLTPARSDTRQRRQGLMAAAAMSQGLVLGPLVNTSLAVAPGVVLAAALATATVFACFSAAALMSPRRQYLYLGGILGAVTMGLLVTQLVGVLAGGSVLSYTGGAVQLGSSASE